MPGDWIPMRVNLRRDPKVIRMSKWLCQSREFMDWWSHPQRVTCDECVTEVVTFENVTRVTVASLLDVWGVVNERISEVGEIRNMAVDDIDDICGVPSFGLAMMKVGWIRLSGNSLIFPNFEEINRPAKQRRPGQSSAERTRRWREKRRDNCVTDVTQCDVSHVTSRVTSRDDTLHNSTRHNKTKKKTPPSPLAIPEVLSTPEFTTAWESWQQHRQEIKKPLTPTSMQKQLETFATWGVRRSVEAINHTIAQGWQGLREKDTAVGGNGHPAKPDPLDEWMRSKTDVDAK
jgi:hypothetical protein